MTLFICSMWSMCGNFSLVPRPSTALGDWRPGNEAMAIFGKFCPVSNFTRSYSSRLFIWLLNLSSFFYCTSWHTPCTSLYVHELTFLLSSFICSSFLLLFLLLATITAPFPIETGSLGNLSSCLDRFLCPYYVTVLVNVWTLHYL